MERALDRRWLGVVGTVGLLSLASFVVRGRVGRPGTVTFALLLAVALLGSVRRIRGTAVYRAATWLAVLAAGVQAFLAGGASVTAALAVALLAVLAADELRYRAVGERFVPW